MKLILRCIAVGLLAFLLLLVGVLLKKDALIQKRAIAEVEKVTGFTMEIDDLELGLFSLTAPLGVALLLGAAFSYWPARAAASINPADALRVE